MSANYPDATTAELFRRLKLRAPIAEQTAAAERMLDVADGEVTSKMGRLDPLLDWEVELATEATIARAVELWQEGEVPFGMVGLDNPTGPAYLPRKSRALAKLLPAQQSWGVA